MTTLIIFIIVLAAGLAIRHYQVKAKHAVNHWRFERSKHDEYAKAFRSKVDELEQLQTMHEMVKYDKMRALRKAVESTKHIMELQEKNAGLMSQLTTANNTIDEVHDLLNSGAKGQETLGALVITGEYRKNN